MRKNKRAIIRALYTDWLNNWLTLQGFADGYAMSLTDANRVLNIGRALKWKQTPNKAT